MQPGDIVTCKYRVYSFNLIPPLSVPAGSRGVVEAIRGDDWEFVRGRSARTVDYAVVRFKTPDGQSFRAHLSLPGLTPAT